MHVFFWGVYLLSGVLIAPVARTFYLGLDVVWSLRQWEGLVHFVRAEPPSARPSEWRVAPLFGLISMKFILAFVWGKLIDWVTAYLLICEDVPRMFS